ncbi:MAG: ferritin family protein [Gammaproteobacteria bacterium]|nr:ferritin family protein [Gammaproteobacteria bacterium]
MNSTHAEGHSSGRQRLENSKTLEEILHTATSFEETARNFYRDLAPKVSKRIRWLVDELADEEQRHFDLFSELMRRDDIGEQIQARVATPAADHRFSDAIHLPDLGDAPDDQAVLQYALGREHAAMEQYRELAAATAPGPIHDLFAFLANEETQHKAELEKLYYEIVHSGGV